jgi:ABC-type phosphate/phosphonate transport system substrate-binding protein
MTKQQWLLSQIAQFPELSARELTGKLSEKKLIPNPKPQEQIPIVPTLEDIIKIGIDENTIKVVETKTYERFVESIRSRSIDFALTNLAILKEGELISEETFNAIFALLQRTEPDPNYQPFIETSDVELAGFDVVYVHEIEELKSQS